MADTKSKIVVREIQIGDRGEWEKLFSDYARFYQVAQTDEMRARTWEWLSDSTSELCGYIAVDERHQAIGLAHVRVFKRPLGASIGLFLDDLFVTPGARGQGVGEMLIRQSAVHAQALGCTTLRWITAEDNHLARQLYEKLAVRIPFATYDLKVGL